MNKKEYIKPATAVVNIEPGQPLTISGGIGGKGDTTNPGDIDASESFSKKRYRPSIWHNDEEQ